MASEEHLQGTRQEYFKSPFSLKRNKVGRFEVLFPIAVGGMGGVHVGRLLGIAGFERLVAIKTILPHLVQDRNYIEMFLDEARLSARIHHPNVAEVFEVGEEDGIFFMVGEFVPGQDLQHLLARTIEKSQPLSQAMSAKICAEVCQGLHAAHELTNAEGKLLHLVHRDISLRNILVSYDGFVKLIDFGVAFANEKLVHTETGALKGKMGFMSKEQIRGEAIDRRSDIFSLGVVLCLMLTGRHPFPGATDVDRLNNVIEGNHLSPKQLRPDLDEDLEKIILRAIAQRPEDRYQTAEEMRKALEATVRKAKTDVESVALGKIMVTLFNDEYSFQKEQLIQTRLHSTKNSQNSQRMTFETLPAETVDSQKILMDHSVVIPKKINVVWGAVAGGLGAVLVAILLIFMTSKSSATHPLSPIQKSTSAAVKFAETEGYREGSPNKMTDQPADKNEHSLHLRVSPSNAQVVLNGQKLLPGAEVAKVKAEQKEHTYEVFASGFHTQKGTIIIEDNEELKIDLVKIVPRQRKKSKLVDKTRQKTTSNAVDMEIKASKVLDIVGSPYK